MFTIKKFCIYQQKNPARLRLKQMSRIKRGGCKSIGFSCFIWVCQINCVKRHRKFDTPNDV